VTIMINYPLALDNWDECEKKALYSVIESGHFTMGSKVKEFESAIGDFFGNKHTIMVNSGSSANLVMLTALKITHGGRWPEGAEVIVPAISWSTTFTPLYYLGLKPVYVDVDPINFGINTELLEAAYSNKTVAVFAVNILGQPTELQILEDFCIEKNIILLEDNCESLGASLNGKFTGRFGLASSHSSFYSHHLATMEGGWISTDSDEFADICRSLRAHGWIRETSIEFRQKYETGDPFKDLFHFILPGLNFRPIEMEGALGVVQLSKFETMLKVRRENAKIFRGLFNNLEYAKLQGGAGESSWFAFALILSGKLEGRRSEVAANLLDAGIQSRPLIAGNFTRQPVNGYLGGRVSGKLEVADNIHLNGMYLGNHPKSLKEELERAHLIISKMD
jgi:CDP-6-deoxy-D-xylo-4-hexulose-3-dehydrase